jgi:hypothetical protein
MNYLSEEDIYTNLTVLQELSDRKIQYDNPHEISNYIGEFCSYFGLATFTLASSIYLYQSKKTPSSIALRDWAREMCDKMDKKLSGLQSILRVVNNEQRTSGFQPH